ncbi:hypothetical protein Tco_0713316 [Tanacetum coccineum]
MVRGRRVEMPPTIERPKGSWSGWPEVGQCSGRVNGGVNGVPDFSTISAQQLQNLLLTIVAQVGNQGRGQGNGRNQNGDAVNENIRGDVSRGCTYKDSVLVTLRSMMVREVV